MLAKLANQLINFDTGYFMERPDQLDQISMVIVFNRGKTGVEAYSRFLNDLIGHVVGELILNHFNELGKYNT